MFLSAQTPTGNCRSSRRCSPSRLACGVALVMTSVAVAPVMAQDEIDIEDGVEDVTPAVEAEDEDDGWYRWFAEWRGGDEVGPDIAQIIETVYGDDIDYEAVLIDVDGDDSAEILLRFRESCREIVRLSDVDDEILACPYVILKQTSRAFWEPIFSGVGHRSWIAVSPDGRPAGIVLDGTFWGWEDGIMMPRGGITLNFAAPSEYQDVPEIFAASESRNMTVAPVETNFLTGWVALENRDAPGDDGSRWRYATAQGEISASGNVDYDTYGLRVVENELGGIEIVSRLGNEVNVERILVGLTTSEWMDLIERPILPPGWAHVQMERISSGESDPNSLFDDIDVIEGGTQARGAIEHDSIRTPHGFLLISQMEGSWCDDEDCPTRISLQDPESGERSDMLSDIMMCRQGDEIVIDAQRLQLRACGQGYDIADSLGIDVE